MRKWTKLGIGLAAVLLAVAAGTGAYAMWGGGDGDGEPAATRQAEDAVGNPQVASEDGGGSGAFAICIEGATDCVDTPLKPDEQPSCPTEGCSAEADCPPDRTDCGVDVLDLGFSCEPGMTVEECLPDGVPADYGCATLESDPIQVKCYPLYCDGTTPLSLDIQERIRAGEIAACDPTPDPCSPEPQPNVRCLPPDCAVSSDGSVSCPGNEPCDPAVSECSVPPSPGVVCPDQPELTPEDCAPIDSGGGSDGERPVEVQPEPAADQ